MYSRQVSLILGAMVLTGAFRSVAVKMFYQLGFEKPFFITILFHIAGLPAFGLYYVQRFYERRKQKEELASDTQESSQVDQSSTTSCSVDFGTTQSTHGEPPDCAVSRSPRQRHDGMILQRRFTKSVSLSEEQDNINPQEGANDVPRAGPPTRGSLPTMGSQTGLTQESHLRAASLLNRIPWCGQLILPGCLDFFTYLARWGTFLLMRASVSEMLLNGTELVTSAMAARLIRGRNISKLRWTGVWIVTLGLVVIGVADILSVQDPTDSKKEDAASKNAGRTLIGIALIGVASLLGTALTMAEEILTQEGDWPVFIVMGNEGLWGLVAGLILYIPVAPLFGEAPSETWQELIDSKLNILYAVALVVLFTTTGAINIFSIALTSSMTRNIWQHLKSIPVWTIGLTIYYSSDEKDNQLGESWVLPNSIFILLGFAIMFAGVYIYYREPPPSNHQNGPERVRRSERDVSESTGPST